MAVEYKPVINAIFKGKLSFIMLGNNTLQIAIPVPIIRVPIIKRVKIEIDRIEIPAMIKSNPITIARSLVNFLASFGTIGDIKAKAIKGRLVNRPAVPLEILMSSLIKPINGPTDVIAGRKLNATKTIPIINTRFCNVLGPFVVT